VLLTNRPLTVELLGTMAIMRETRRVLGPAWRGVRRWRARRSGPAALLYTSTVSPQDLRWIVTKARSRGHDDLVEAALLALVRRGKATEVEQRQIRQTTATPPVPGTSGTAATSPRTVPGGAGHGPGSGPFLVLRRPVATGPVCATLTGVEVGRDVRQVWRDAWSALPPSLADQLAVCALTRFARAWRVTGIQAGDAAAAGLARAIADGIDAFYGGGPGPAAAAPADGGQSK